MSKIKDVANIADIYVPMNYQLVFEFEMICKTKAGVEIPEHLQKKYQDEQMQKQGFAKRVVAVGPNVKQVKVGNWILINSATARVNDIPLINKGNTGDKHGQIHEYDVLGIVDEHFAQLKPETKTLETIN